MRIVSSVIIVLALALPARLARAGDQGAEALTETIGNIWMLDEPDAASRGTLIRWSATRVTRQGIVSEPCVTGTPELPGGRGAI